MQVQTRAQSHLLLNKLNSCSQHTHSCDETNPDESNTDFHVQLAFFFINRYFYKVVFFCKYTNVAVVQQTFK